MDKKRYDEIEKYPFWSFHYSYSHIPKNKDIELKRLTKLKHKDFFVRDRFYIFFSPIEISKGKVLFIVLITIILFTGKQSNLRPAV